MDRSNSKDKDTNCLYKCRLVGYLVLATHKAHHIKTELRIPSTSPALRNHDNRSNTIDPHTIPLFLLPQIARSAKMRSARSSCDGHDFRPEKTASPNRGVSPMDTIFVMQQIAQIDTIARDT